MDIKEHVEQVLRRRFADAVEIDVQMGSYGRIDALVVSGTLVGVGDSDRQKTLWDALRQELPRDELVQVSFVLASTPQVEDAMPRHPADEA